MLNKLMYERTAVADDVCTSCLVLVQQGMSGFGKPIFDAIQRV